MAETAALKLGNVISTSISGSFASLANGVKGALSEGVGFQTVTGALTKGFNSLQKDNKNTVKSQKEFDKTQAAFVEEQNNEQRYQDKIALAVQKGMAINIEIIQKDVRQILEIMSKETIWDKLANIFKGLLGGLAGLSGFISKFIEEVLGSIKSFVGRIGDAIDAIVDFLKALPNKIGTFINDIFKFLGEIPNKIGTFINDIFKFLGEIPNKIGTIVEDVFKFFSSIPSRIGTAIEDVFKFFSSIPSRIGTAIEDIFKFFSSIPSRIGTAIEDIGKFFLRLVQLFDDFTLNHLPNTRAAIAKFFSDLADIFKLDALKTSFLNQLKKLETLFDFEDIFTRIGTKLNDFVKALDESEIAKFFRRVKNIFAISLAQYLDELDDLFNNKLLASLNSLKTSISNLGPKIMGAIDEAVDALKTSRLVNFAQEFGGKTMSFVDNAIDGLKASRLVMFGEEFGGKTMSFVDNAIDTLKASRLANFGQEFGGKIMSFFDTAVETAKSTKLGTLADDIVKIGGGIFKDIGILVKTGVAAIAPDVSEVLKIGSELFKGIGSSIKTGLGALTPDVSDLKTFFTLGKEAMNMDELKYVLGEGGLFQKTATLIGKFAGDIGTVFRPILNFFTGNNLLGQIAGFDEIAKLFSGFGKLVGTVITKGLKAIPVIGWIITAIEGIMAGFNTDQIAEDLGKEAEKVTLKDRLIAGLSGAIASIPGGIIDLVRMGINALFDTKLETSGPDSVQGRLTSYLTKALSDLGSIVGSTFSLLIGLVTFDKKAIDSASSEIGKTFDSMLKDLGDIFTRYATLPAKHVYNSAIGFVEGITNWMIDGINRLIGAAIEAIPSKFETRFGTIEFISQDTKKAWKESLSMGKVDMSGAKADTSKDQARVDEVDKKRLEDRARIQRQTEARTRGEETLKRTGVKANSTAGAGRGGDPRQFMTQDSASGYTAKDLSGMGLNVRPYGDVQKAGAFISPVTIAGAKDVQSGVSGVTFTGFNDRYHQEKSPNSLHTKGLAFDFVIPPNLATNDTYRESVANAVANGTGGRVIDEYARPSAKSTGGHFHVDFAGGKEVDLGTGSFAGIKKDTFPSIPAPQEPTYSADAAGGSADLMADLNVDQTKYSSPIESQTTMVAAIDYSRFRESVAGGISDTLLESKDIFSNADVVTALKELKNDLENNFENRIELAFLRSFSSREFKDNLTSATEEGHWAAINRRASPSLRDSTISTSTGVNQLRTSVDAGIRKEDVYEKERRALQQEFNNELKGIFNPLVNTVLGPAGDARRQSDRQGGRNIVGTYLDKDFKKLGVQIFGKEQGAAIGETFQKLAGVYMDEFIDKALAPALGMDSKYLNRSINTFLEGYKLTQPKVKELEKRIGESKKELETFKKEKGDITTADIIRAGGRKGFTKDEQSRLNEINRINEKIARDQEQLSKIKSTQKEYKKAAVGDLIYGMTGIAITPRNAVEQIYGEKGSQGLVEDLASIFGAPFGGLFNKGISQPTAPQVYGARTPGFVPGQPAPVSTRDSYNRLAEITNREIQSRKDIVAQEKQSRENIITREIEAKTDLSQTEIDSRKQSVDAQKTNDQQHIQDVYGVYQENVQSTYAVNQTNLQSQIALNDSVQTNQVGIFDWFINSMNSVFTAGADLFKNVMSNISVGGGSGGNILTGLIGDVGSSVVKGAIQDLTKDTAADAADYITDEFGNIFKAPSSSGTIIPGDDSYDVAETAKFLRQAKEGGVGGVNNIPMAETSWTDAAKNFFGGKTGSAALNRVGSFATNYITGAISNKISNALGGGFSGQLGGKIITDMGLNFLQTGAMNPIQSIGKSFGMNLSSGATFSDLLSSFSKYGSSMMVNLGSTVSSLGANLGSQFMTELGAGMVQSGAGAAAGSGATSAMNMGQSLGSIGAAAGNAFMAYNLSKMIGGEYKTGLPINEIAALASFIPGVGPIAGVVGGLINRAFGMGPKKVRATRIAGNLKKDGSNLRTEQDWKKKGGWFRKSKYGTDITAFSQEDTNAVNEVLGGIYENLDIVSKGLKLDIGRAFDFSKDINFDVTGLSAEQQQKKWQEIFTAFNDEMYQYTFGAPLEAARKVKKDAQGKEVVDEKGNKVLESYEETLLRLTNVDQLFNKSMRSILEISGKNIDTLFTRVTGQLDNATKILVADMKDAFIKAAGGLENLIRVENEFIDLFYTEDEKRAQAIKDANRQVSEALANTGVTTSEFTSESFGTTAQLQSQTLEDFMEAQRIRYRRMVEDFERSYGWKLSSGDEKLVEEYGVAYEKIKDAGSDFLTAAKLTWDTAQKTKEKDAPVEIVYTQRARGEGASAIGELQFSSGGQVSSPVEEPTITIPTPVPLAVMDSSIVPVTPVTPVTPVSTPTPGVENFDMVIGSIKDLNTSGSIADKQQFYNSLITSNTITKEKLDSLILEHGTTKPGFFRGPKQVQSTDDWLTAKSLASTFGSLGAGVVTLFGGLTDSNSSLGAHVGSLGASANNMATTFSDSADSVAAAATGLTAEAAMSAVSMGASVASFGQAVQDSIGQISIAAMAVGVVAEALGNAAMNSNAAALAAVDMGMVGGPEGLAANAAANAGMAAADVGNPGAADMGGVAVSGDAAAAAGVADGASEGAGSSSSADGGVGSDSGDYASGGPFKPLSPMIVGEAGPEIIVPGQGGTVIPTHKIFQAIKNSTSYDSMARNAIESVVANKNDASVIIQNVQSTPGTITPAYMAQQEMNRMLQAERDIVTSINSSMVNQTINNVSSPTTSIVSNGSSGGVRSDNPITGAFTRSLTKPRMY